MDPSNDLAVLRFDMHGVPRIVPLTRGDSTSVRVGDPTLTIGNPFGVDRTLTSGIVSALQHQIEAADGSSINNVIQTDQPSDAGNSGAPLLDADGHVIGINSQMVTGGGGVAQRLAFAIPIDTADAILSKVNGARRRRRSPTWGSPRPPSASAVRTRRAGAVVGVVTKDSPAQQAGLRDGDTIVRVDAMPVHSVADVLAIVSTRSPGQSRDRAVPARSPPAHRRGDAGQPDRAAALRRSSVPAVRTMWGVDPHAPRSSSAASPTPPTPRRRSRPAPGRWA